MLQTFRRNLWYRNNSWRFVREFVFTVYMICTKSKTNIPTKYMEQSPYWENRSSDCQEILRVLWNTKIHCRSHKSPPAVPIPSHSNPAHSSQSHILKIRFNITLPSIPGSPKWSFSLRHPHQNPLYNFPVPHFPVIQLDLITPKTFVVHYRL